VGTSAKGIRSDGDTNILKIKTKTISIKVTINFIPKKTSPNTARPRNMFQRLGNTPNFLMKAIK